MNQLHLSSPAINNRSLANKTLTHGFTVEGTPERILSGQRKLKQTSHIEEELTKKKLKKFENSSLKPDSK